MAVQIRGQLGGTLESHALWLNSKAEFILGDKVSSCLKGLVRIILYPQTPLSAFAISAQPGLVFLIAKLRAWQVVLLMQSALSSSLKALVCLVPLSLCPLATIVCDTGCYLRSQHWLKGLIALLPPPGSRLCIELVHSASNLQEQKDNRLKSFLLLQIET